MGTLRQAAPSSLTIHEHAENAQDLGVILQQAIGQKTFGTSLDGLKYKDVKKLRDMIEAKVDERLRSVDNDIRVAKSRSGIRGKLGAIIRFIPGMKMSKPTESPETGRADVDDYPVLNELRSEAFEAMRHKRNKEFTEADQILQKTLDEMFPDWLEGARVRATCGEMNIAPTRRNHGYIQVGYEQSAEDMRDFIAAHLDESRRINTQIEKEIAAINEGREITFDLFGSGVAYNMNQAKEELELENRFPQKSLDIDDAMARMRELAGADEVLDLPKGTRICIAAHYGAYYGYDRNLVISLNGTESVGQNRAWIKEALKKHKSGALLTEEADKAVKDAGELVARVDETTADFHDMDAELAKITGEPPYYPDASPPPPEK